MFIFYVSAYHRALPSFPTRRSSDLVVHVGDRDGRAQRAYERSDVVELRIEGRPVMHEGDARLGGDVGEVKLRLRWGIAGAGRATVQDDDERDGGQERNADDALAPDWARKSHGVSDRTGRVGYTRNARRARTCPRAWRG